MEEKECQKINNMKKALERLEEQKASFVAQGGDSRLDTEQTEAKIRFMQEQLDTLVREWKDNYESYYNVDQEYEVLTISDVLRTSITGKTESDRKRTGRK